MTSHVSSPAQARRRLGPQLAVRLPSREEEMQSRREIEISPQLTPRGPQTGEWGAERSAAGGRRGVAATRGLGAGSSSDGWPYRSRLACGASARSEGRCVSCTSTYGRERRERET